MFEIKAPTSAGPAGRSRCLVAAVLGQEESMSRDDRQPSLFDGPDNVIQFPADVMRRRVFESSLDHCAEALAEVRLSLQRIRERRQGSERRPQAM